MRRSINSSGKFCRSITRLQTAAFCAAPCGVLAGSSAAHAAYISSTPDPFLGSTFQLQSATPINTPFGFTSQFNVSNFVETAVTSAGGNENVGYTATSLNTFYTSPTETTPAYTGNLTGTFQATVNGRVSQNAPGTFVDTITTDSFSGLVAGQTFAIQLNPISSSTGTVSIVSAAGGQYTITNTAQVYDQYTVNGGPSNAFPVLNGNGVLAAAVPEPASLSLLGFGALGLLRRRSRRVGAI